MGLDSETRKEMQERALGPQEKDYDQGEGFCI